ncbi:MAG: DUF4070 domain-containing protein [Verrucomicrobia bacterium]|jgi:radical SAM superfamily enzyme YgiQ (UPF0313 family)|nr:DUF4070 domain-containing protein [Verrucomicrobiota bacterium]MBT7065766.1 DUF4070 domain-containing protein [Verrucomicrobiota bacterium]MBT7700686.1 DUF4070 domain-containing protein [Verrucomicrobiota bacterium]
MADIVLINPRCKTSYWGLEFALPLFGKRAALPPAGLALLAAVTPPEHRVTIMDENVAPLDFGKLARADLVGVTGMSVQRFRMAEILDRLQPYDCVTLVGGPWVTVSESYFKGQTDVIFIGEAETAWPRFLHDWQHGTPQPRYAQAERTDLTRLPLPRWDLVSSRHYLFGSIQLSRGCPHACDFCDIIITYGHQPRMKTTSQVLAELDLLRHQHKEIVFIVDDNMMADRRGMKALLRELVDWQQRHGFPFFFAGQASIDCADDAELLALMTAANVQALFIGLETPSETALRGANKRQNVQPDRGDMVQRVHRIQEAGIDVASGMIVGFDSDDARIFDAHLRFACEARIAQVMTGMLYAIPKTPFYDRLKAEGRIDMDDRTPFGTNVRPARLSRAELSAGFLKLLSDLYEPAAYFSRMDALFLNPDIHFAPARATYMRTHRLARLRDRTGSLLRCAYLAWQMQWHIPERALRAEYRGRMRGWMRQRREPFDWFCLLVKCAFHYHYYCMTRQPDEQPRDVVNTF